MAHPDMEITHGQDQEGFSSHQDYLDTLLRPSAAQSRRISDIQVRKEVEIEKKYHASEEHEAATRIQRTYRGHRERRQLSGLTLDPSARWIEIIREWKFRTAIAPPTSTFSLDHDGRPRTPSDVAKSNWRRVGGIAEHAVTGGTDPAPAQSSFAPDRSTRQRSDTQSSMLLDLRYFLEMVDEKHRYGANLLVYHEEWQRSNTDQNFFVWLDCGEGKQLDLPLVSRQKLDRERVRYLSKEERMDYLVRVDKDGLLRWEKNNELITTSGEQYQDSLHGIVPKGEAEKLTSSGDMSKQPLGGRDITAVPIVVDPANACMETRSEPTTEFLGLSSSESEDEPGSESRNPEALHSNHSFGKVPSGRTKARRHFHVSPATILNSLLRASVRPGTWIYVADLAGRLYVGIKASGSFQHASFLSGTRISSAGSIGIDQGRLTYLSPLSGHYRPTTSSFNQFVESLKREGIDLSSLKVSKAYAVLLGMEYYGRTKGEVKKILHRERRDTRNVTKTEIDDEQRTSNVADASQYERHSSRAHRGLGKLLKDLNIRWHGHG